MNMEISNPMDYKAALYIRLSKEDDNERESESVSNQKSMLKTFAENQQLDVYDIYIDDGFSGTDFDRPAFQKLLKDIKNKKVNMVITKDMSRLGRDYIQTGFYLERYFPENRVRYISLLDNIDTGTESSMNDITPFKAIMNDMYAKDISKKIKSVKEDKQKKGLFIGGKASYGYKKSPTEKNKIVIDEETADVVRRIFNLALEGKSGREIAQILTQNNIPTPSCYANIKLPRKSPFSYVWNAEKVTFILKNQVYIGNMVQGRTKKINYKSKKTVKLPGDQWIIVPNTHEPIIEKEVFDKVQLLLEKRRLTRTRTLDYLLKGLVYCHECGKRMAVMSRTLSGNKEVMYLLCRTYQRFTSYNKCTCHNIRVDAVTEKVLRKIKEVCLNYIDNEEMMSIAENEIQRAGAVKQSENNRKLLFAKIDNLTHNLDKVYQDKLSGVLSESDFIRIYERIKEERIQLQQKLEQIKEKQACEAGYDEKVKELINRFLNTTDTNKELIFSLIDRIEITKDLEILVFFRFQNPEHLS
jgi:DNA invertase Pin-like site-specific DNA recombinase